MIAFDLVSDLSSSQSCGDGRRSAAAGTGRSESNGLSSSETSARIFSGELLSAASMFLANRFEIGLNFFFLASPKEY